MFIANNIPVQVSKKAEHFIEAMELREPFQRMLDHIPEHFRGVEKVNVVFNICHDQSAGPWAVIEVTRADPGPARDDSDWDWITWETANFPPEQLQYLLVFSYYPQADDAR